MAEETRYFTLSGNVPNGGVPPGRMMASLALVPPGPYPSHHPFTPGPFSGGHAPPPPYHSPQNNGKILQRADMSQPLSFDTATPPPGPPAPAPAAPPSNGASYEPPGQYLDGRMLRGDGWSYLTPTEHTTIHFVNDGTRPCDTPDGYYRYRFDFTTHKVPTTMTVCELIQRLGAPAGDQNGITEMVALPDYRFLAAETITQGSEDANKTLREMGWTQRRSEAAPIWIVVKR